MPRPRWAPVAVVAVFALLAGCSGNGDFGRVRASLKHDDTHAWLGPAASRKVSDPPWRHQLTEEERRLRDLAYPLIEPPYDRNRWYSALAENTGVPLALPFPDRGAYASRLFQTAYRSQTARYNKLIEDMRNDVVRIDSFFQLANYVADMDKRRDKAMAYVSGLTTEERDNTINRIRENDGIVRWVQASLRERAASYQIALERLVIAAPTQMAVEAERSLALLNQKIANYR
jgi:hypothetical protein